MSESTSELLEFFEKKFCKNTCEFSFNIEWNEISKSQDPYLSEEFIRECNRQLNWVNISRYQKLSSELLEEFQDRIYYCYLNKHNKINWLKYKLKSGKITEEQYLRELIKCQCQIKN